MSTFNGSNTDVTPTGANHAGEIWLQNEMGVRAIGEKRSATMLTSAFTERQRDFIASRPFFLTSHVRSNNIPKAGLIKGQSDFFTFTGQGTVLLSKTNSQFLTGEQIETGDYFGFLAIDFESRNRARINTRVIAECDQYWELQIDQLYGNCSKYIAPHQWSPNVFLTHSKRSIFSSLNSNLQDKIRNAKTFFIASSSGPANSHSHNASGADISHRGIDSEGFHVSDNKIRFVDYPGNNMFNTLGNLKQYPRASLLFVDFLTGERILCEGDVTLLRNGAHFDTELSIQQVTAWN